MKLKRNLVVVMMSLMVAFSAVLGYAATATTGPLLEKIQGGRANLKAHAYLTESGFLRHTGKASGTLYYEELRKTGWFDSVYCDIYEDGDYDPDNILCHDEDED